MEEDEKKSYSSLNGIVSVFSERGRKRSSLALTVLHFALIFTCATERESVWA